MSTRIWILSLVCLLLAAAVPGAAMGQATYPPRIGDRDFVSDNANLLTPEDKAKVRSACESLLETSGTPLIVVTINSMADYGASGWQIERYAMNLFDEWGIGHTGARNSGVLMLVSKGDRKVRIELGAGWSHDKDAAAASVVNGTIVPRFKAGQYSEGIREGVVALAGQLGAPAGTRAAAPAAPSGYNGMNGMNGVSRGAAPSMPLHSTGLSKLLGPVACVVIPVIFIIIISIVSRMGRGAGGMMGGGGMGPGYGPSGWGGGWGGGGGGGFLNGAILGGLLGNAWGSRNSGSSWGGFGGGGSSSGGGFSGGGFGGGGGGGGGSFGGGFSGGGGATGSW